MRGMEHEAVRELLGAWAVGALEPGEEAAVAPHLADCPHCAAEARQLRSVVRELEGPLEGGREDRVNQVDRARTLAPALEARPAAARTAAHAAPYAAAVAGLHALLAELGGNGAREWGFPVVHDWDVHDTLAHLVAADEPLSLSLGLPARVPAPGGPPPVGTPWRDVWAARTAEVIGRERCRPPCETVALWREQSAALLAAPAARDPERAACEAELMGSRMSVADHYRVRAFETWVHADDIGRALDRPVPPPPGPHLWQLVRLAVRILGTALGPSAPPVALTVTGDGRADEWRLGETDGPERAQLALDAVDFCRLMGGRLPPHAVGRRATGDDFAVRAVLERAGSLAWL